MASAHPFFASAKSIWATAVSSSSASEMGDGGAASKMSDHCRYVSFRNKSSRAAASGSAAVTSMPSRSRQIVATRSARACCASRRMAEIANSRTSRRTPRWYASALESAPRASRSREHASSTPRMMRSMTPNCRFRTSLATVSLACAARASTKRRSPHAQKKRVANVSARRYCEMDMAPSTSVAAAEACVAAAEAYTAAPPETSRESAWTSARRFAKRRVDAQTSAAWSQRPRSIAEVTVAQASTVAHGSSWQASAKAPAAASRESSESTAAAILSAAPMAFRARCSISVSPPQTTPAPRAKAARILTSAPLRRPNARAALHIFECATTASSGAVAACCARSTTCSSAAAARRRWPRSAPAAAPSAKVASADAPSATAPSGNSAAASAVRPSARRVAHVAAPSLDASSGSFRTRDSSASQSRPAATSICGHCTPPAAAAVSASAAAAAANARTAFPSPSRHGAPSSMVASTAPLSAQSCRCAASAQRRSRSDASRTEACDWCGVSARVSARLCGSSAAAMCVATRSVRRGCI
mmetsp:Transcript_25509/g.87581  ORF Transcript_25509/g.87581 Transcript_25509/m.87581 type:complete len:532 (-) Transcript_25509:23-1618(-)